MLRRTPTDGASEGARSIWNEEHSITWMRLSDGGSRERIAVPILPPICTSRPASRRIWAMRAVVVDLPLVPVIATKGAFGAIFARSRQKSSISPMISTPASRASFADQCGSGWVSGTPGERMKDENCDQSTWRRSAVSMPLEPASAILAGLSSQAMTRAPPSFKASTVASPEPPRPKRATVLPAKEVTGVMRLPEFQGGEAGERQHHGDD